MAFTNSDFEGTSWTVRDGDAYVSTIGNDISGDGTPKKPYLTIGRAFEDVGSGGKIVIGPDEYVTVDNTGFEESGAELGCRVVATSDINLATGGLLTIDGVTLVEGDRVLLMGQSAPSQNGIYIALSSSWVRASNFDSATNMTIGALVPILEGDTYGRTILQHTTPGPITINVTAISFEKIVVTDWGELQGDISNQADLIDRLNNKADKNENETISGLWTFNSLSMANEENSLELSCQSGLLQIKTTTNDWAGIVSGTGDDTLWAFRGGNTGAGIYDMTNEQWSVKAIENSKVELYYNGTVILETTETGIEITGKGVATSDWSVSSDQRLKSVVDKLPDAMDIVRNMQAYRFTRKDLNDERTRVGFMAQEVNEILPEVVSEQNDQWSMDYASITAVHNEAIKKMDQEIERLHIKILELEQQLAD